MDKVEELGRVRATLAGIPGAAALLETLFALAPVGFQIYDAGGRSLLVNQAFRELFGSEPPPEYNVLVDEIAAENGLLDLVKRAFAGEVVSMPPFWYDPRELRQVTVTEGRRVAIALTLFPLRDPGGCVTHVGTVVKDVTSEMEKQAREDRARAEAEFLASCSAVLASSLDFETTLRSLARVAIPHFADWCVIDLIGDGGGLWRVATAHVDPEKERLLSDIRRLYPAHDDSPQPAAQVIRTGRPVLLAEIDAEAISRHSVDEHHRQMLKDLGPRSLLVVPLVAREKVIGTINFALGASGRKYGPDDLRVAQDLASRAALAVDNARLYHEAREAIQIREDFLSIAGHELKTPLTAMQIKLELMGRAAQRTLGSAASETDPLTHRLADVDRQMTRLSLLVDQLLDVTRLATGRVTLETSEIDLAALGREVVNRFADEAARAETPLGIRAAEPVVGVWDRGRLDQILSNLIANALKYGAGKPVEIEVAGAADHALVRVRDGGIGIAPENQVRIFRKFERAVSERHFGGLGIGLWICHELVEAMDGSIEVESAPGQGATFTVRLARAPISSALR